MNKGTGGKAEILAGGIAFSRTHSTAAVWRNFSLEIMESSGSLRKMLAAASKDRWPAAAPYELGALLASDLMGRARLE